MRKSDNNLSATEQQIKETKNVAQYQLLGFKRLSSLFVVALQHNITSEELITCMENRKMAEQKGQSHVCVLLKTIENYLTSLCMRKASAYRNKDCFSSQSDCCLHFHKPIETHKTQ